jgi:surface carbohydrate biosynthesis protein
MFVRSLLNIFRKILIAKYFFSKPKQSKIILFDSEAENYLKRVLGIKNYLVIDSKFRIINLYILFYLLINFKLSKINYFLNYIRFVSPSIVITFVDNSILFYKFKNFFPKIKFIAIQNGHRTKYRDFFDNLKKYKNSNDLKCDVFFSFNKYVAKEYQKYITCDSVPIGSFKNNYVKISKLSNNNAILFISQFRKGDSSKKNFFLTENKILPIIYKFCEERGIKFSILGCQKNYQEEIKFFKRILKEKNFQYIKKKIYPHNYKILDFFQAIVFIDSTLGYESLARKKKVAIFSNRKNKINNLFKTERFAWPKKIPLKGFFYTDSILEYEIRRILKNVLYSSQKQWNKALTNFNDICIYDYKNSILKDKLNKIILN